MLQLRKGRSRNLPEVSRAGSAQGLLRVGWLSGDTLTLCMWCSQEFRNLKTFQRIDSEVLTGILGSGFSLGENSQKAPLQASYSGLFSRDIFGCRQMYQILLFKALESTMVDTATK